MNPYRAAPLPLPRLWHCSPGSTITLAGDTRARTINHIQGRHAVMSDGLIVSVCHPVHRDCMQFGDGAGWRPLSTEPVRNPGDDGRTSGVSPCSVEAPDALVTEAS